MDKYKLVIFLLYLAICLCKDNSSAQMNSTQETKNSTDPFFPKEVLDNYAEYMSLDEVKTNLCNLENQMENYDEASFLRKIKILNCIPNPKTLATILDAGWYNVTEYLIKEVYLPNYIDPVSIVYTYAHKTESKLKSMLHLLENAKYESLPLVYTFENFDNTIKFKIKLPDASFVSEYISILCYKDMFKLNATFKSRHKLYKLKDTKRFFDLVQGECEYTYNNFENVVQLSFTKVNKFKKWDRLFKI